MARFTLESSQRLPTSTTIVGVMPTIRVGEMLRLSGEWQTHPVHGRNFRVEAFEPQLPASAEGIERYLASGAIKGIGPVTARRIVDSFGERSIQVIDSEPQSLRSITGISENRLAVISAAWSEQKRVRALMMFLQEHSLSVALAARLYDAYKDDAIEVIRRDPYQLASDVHGVGFRTADAIAARLGVGRQSTSRYVAGIKHVVSQATDAGHVCIPRSELLAAAAKLLETPSAQLEPALLESLRRQETVLEGDAVYLKAFHHAEVGIARHLGELLAAPSVLLLDRSFDAGTAARRAGASQGLELAPGQLAAAEQALTKKISIITGGPGTGKTSTLRTIISALEEHDVTYCLCAPTGRAAKRAAEAAGRAASTIHRLLEFQPADSTFRFDRTRPLPYDFVIVDEVSMIDTLLLYHLLKAVPRESHLLLVGDADQLPSVGPGNVLADLLESGKVATTTLTELFRQASGSEIVVAAHGINEGRVPTAGANPNNDFFFVREDDEADVLKAVKLLVMERIPRKFGLDPVEDIQVLSPMHGGIVGVSSLNTELQALLNPPLSSRPELERGERLFRLGDKVMQVRNNYDKEVYNGDVGRVVGVRREELRLTIQYPDLTGLVDVDYAGSEVDELVLAYAVSVHKSQGSEFPCIVMPLVSRHSIMLQRNLLYTAVTRARQLCVLVGSQRALHNAVATARRRPRNTQLVRRVRDVLAAPGMFEI